MLRPMNLRIPLKTFIRRRPQEALVLWNTWCGKRSNFHEFDRMNLRHATRGTSTPYISWRLVFSHGQILGPGGGHTGSWQSERIYIELVSYDVLHNSQRVLPPGCRLLGRVMRPWHPQFTHVAPDRSANVQWMLYELPMLFSKFRLRVGLQVEITNASSSSDKSFQS